MHYIISNLVIDSVSKPGVDENEEMTETLKEFWKHEARGLKETEKEDDEGKSETSREVMDIEFNSSPAILGATLLKHASQFELQFPAIVNVLNMLYCRNYCDDLSCSTVKLDDAFEIFQKTRVILAKGGFNLCQWRTNDKGLLQEIEQVEKSTATASGNSSRENSCQTETFTKVLGVHWDSESDDLFYDLSSVLEFAQLSP